MQMMDDFHRGGAVVEKAKLWYYCINPQGPGGGDNQTV
jgi:hypothetical protein